MSKGFRKKQQSKQQYIKNLFSSSRAICAGFATPEEAKSFYSKKWFAENIKNHYNYSADELLNPETKELAIHRLDGQPVNNMKPVLVGYNGLWRIAILERGDKSMDFVIGVLTGATYRYHSDVIKCSICGRHGKQVYEQWRKMVRADIESLRVLVASIKAQLTAVPWSYTCSKSAANLCEQVGITTYRGTAFLFPNSYS